MRKGIEELIGIDDLDCLESGKMEGGKEFDLQFQDVTLGGHMGENSEYPWRLRRLAGCGIGAVERLN